MSTSYYWKFTLDERGYEEVPKIDYRLGEVKKDEYVEKYLSPSVKYAKCGWDHVKFCVLKNEYERAEFVILCPEENNNNGRYIDVGEISLGAISEAVWNCVFY